MSCNCQPAPVFSIFQGDAKTMNMKAVYADSGDPLDLASCTAITVYLPKANGTFLGLTLASGAVAITTPSTLGKIAATISSVNSALLNVGEFQDVDVTYTISAKPQTVRYKGALSVFARD